MEFNKFLSFKKVLVLLVLASILLMGCSESSWNTPPGGVDENGEDDDELPPAPPEDSGTGESISDEQPPLPPDDNDEPLAPPSDEINSNENKAITTTSLTNNPSEFVGLWRAFSSRMFYDIGGGGAVGSGTGQPLEINADGSWQLSTSAGKWRVESINLEDWKKWNIESYGPTRKIILENWNGGIADGPAEESDGRVDFFWVMYRAEPPTVSSSGQVQAKYGHAS